MAAALDRREEEYAVRMSHYVEPILAHLADDDVTEVYTDPASGEVWVAKRGVREPTGESLTEMSIRAFLNVVAERQKETLDRRVEHIQAQLPIEIFAGARLQGLTPRIVEKPCFNLRKRASRYFPLGDYVRGGVLDEAHCQAIRAAIASHKNILVFGGTGSGKTTLVNAILGGMAEACPDEDFLILEDTQELQCPARATRYMTQSLTTPLRELVKLALRMFPDRIIVGEVRDEAALDLMDAWLTGHPGGTGTVHASSPVGALRRMERLARRATDTDHSVLVAEAIDLVVGIERTGAGREVRHVAWVSDELDAEGNFLLEPVPTQSAPTQCAPNGRAAGRHETIIEDHQ